MPLKLKLLKPKPSQKRHEESSSAPAPPGPVTIVSEYWRQSSPHVLRQEIAQRLRRPGARKEVVTAISCERLEFKLLWNRSLPVNQLPYDVIADIFALILANIIENMQIRLYDTGFWRLMEVCRHWRDVIVATPTLWRTIELGRKVDWINLCFSRSLTAPIDVRGLVPDRYKCYRRNTARLVFPLRHRLRSLDLEVCAAMIEWEVDAVRTLPLLFSDGIPSLEKLRLHISQQLHNMYCMPIAIELTSQHLPRLHSLVLIGMVAPRDPSLYTQLRILSLTGSAHDLSFDRFLDAIASCSRLEELHLKDTLHHLSGDWTHGPEPRPREPPISHPHLKEFVVSGHGAACTARFLAHFHLHSYVSLLISAELEDKVEGVGGPSPLRTGDATFSVTSMLPSNHAANFEPLAVSNKINMRMSFPHLPVESCDIHFDAAYFPPHAPTRRGAAGVSLTMTIPVACSRANAVARLLGALSDLVEVFGRSPVTSLSVNVDAEGPTDTVALWTSVFLTFPLLERLDVFLDWWGPQDVDSASPIENVFRGLHAASRSMPQAAPASLGDASSSTRRPVVCPNLRHVTVSGFGTPGVYEAMRTCVRARANRGEVLQKLDLRLYDGPGVSASPVRRACIRDILDYTEELKGHLVYN